MERNEIKGKIAPCSLMCHTCSAYRNGVICESAKTLLKYLDGIKEFYEKNIPNAVESYIIFEDVLRRYSEAGCHGCRSKKHCRCSIEGCFILECTKKHNVYFCGECNEFPCSKVHNLFEETVYNQWLEGNKQIKDYGIEYYWKTNSENPHYRPYKK